jgi:hypothetical protein
MQNKTIGLLGLALAVPARNSAGEGLASYPVEFTVP